MSSSAAQARTLQARKQFLHDVFVNALEGGMMQWADVRSYRWSTGEPGYSPDLNGFEATIVEVGDGDVSVPYRINAGVISLGIDRIIGKRMVRTIARDLRHTLEDAYEDKDASDVDAVIADAIVQAGLFNEVRYG